MSALILSLILPAASGAAEMESRLYWNIPLAKAPSSLTLELAGDGASGIRPELARVALDGSAIDIVGLGLVRDGEMQLGVDTDFSIAIWGVVGAGVAVGVGFAIATDGFCFAYNNSCGDDDDDVGPR